MPATKRGVYHNLKESKYTISNSEVVLFFSSEFYLNKFLAEYEENRSKYRNKFKKDDVTKLNFDTLYDVLLYKNIEKRGYRVTLRGLEIDEKSVEHYALRKMLEKESPTWKRIKAPSLKDRVKKIRGVRPHSIIIDERVDLNGE